MTLNAFKPGCWFVLKTKPKQELRAQDNLNAWGLETLLPQWPAPRKSKRSRRDSIRALFPSYIFCRFPDSMLDKVRFTHGVSYVVAFGPLGPAVVDQQIIDGIRARIDERGVVRAATVRPQLQPGDRVIIEAGPFQHLVGVFEREMPESKCIQILLDTVKLTAKVECSVTEIRKLS